MLVAIDDEGTVLDGVEVILIGAVGREEVVEDMV